MKNNIKYQRNNNNKKYIKDIYNLFNNKNKNKSDL